MTVIAGMIREQNPDIVEEQPQDRLEKPRGDIGRIAREPEGPQCRRWRLSLRSGPGDVSCLLNARKRVTAAAMTTTASKIPAGSTYS